MKIAQSDQWVADNWWNWSVWIEAPPEELDTIEYVDWLLHPSFPDPHRRVHDRASQFRLESSGWGTFPIVAKVRVKGAATERHLSHRLQLRLPDGGAVSDSTNVGEIDAQTRVEQAPAKKGAGNGRRRALCVGINAYPASHALSGAVNDANQWSAALEGLGFEVIALYDQAATRAAIVDGLETMVAQAGAGDVVVFQFAGHGTQLPSDADEIDFGEAFCPIDFDSGAFVTGDDLTAALSRLKPEVNATFFIDCCHSGTVRRAVTALSMPQKSDSRRARFIRLTHDQHERYFAFRAARQDETSAATPDGRSRLVYFAACQPTESAFEEAGAGLFSKAAVQVLQEKPLVTNAAFLDMVSARLAATIAPQHPTLECPPEARNASLLQNS